MTFEQLEYFIAAADYNTFLDAAESLHISQSSLSKQIKKLELELGVTLIDRSRRTASLTKAGEVFYKDALALSRQYHETLCRVQDFQKSSGAELCVGTLPVLPQYNLTALFRDFSEEHKEIHVTLEEVEDKELQAGLEDGRYDLVIARKNILNPNYHLLNPLTADELAVILPSGHRLAGRASVPLEELCNENFLLMNPYTSIYKLCMEKLEATGIPFRLLRTARAESIISAVSIGEGISLLPRSNLRVFHHENVTSVPLEPPIELSLYLALKKNHKTSQAAKTLIAFFLQKHEKNR